MAHAGVITGVREVMGPGRGGDGRTRGEMNGKEKKKKKKKQEKKTDNKNAVFRVISSSPSAFSPFLSLRWLRGANEPRREGNRRSGTMG